VVRHALQTVETDSGAVELFGVVHASGDVATVQMERSVQYLINKTTIYKCILRSTTSNRRKSFAVQFMRPLNNTMIDKLNTNVVFITDVVFMNVIYDK
jgi:hypothetical protein